MPFGDFPSFLGFVMHINTNFYLGCPNFRSPLYTLYSASLDPYLYALPKKLTGRQVIVLAAVFSLSVLCPLHIVHLKLT